MRKLFNKLSGTEFTRQNSSSKLGSIMRDASGRSGRSLFSAISVGQSTSFGIKTDPLVKFSIIFSALVHGTAHEGSSCSFVCRTQLMHAHFFLYRCRPPRSIKCTAYQREFADGSCLQKTKYGRAKLCRGRFAPRISVSFKCLLSQHLSLLRHVPRFVSFLGPYWWNLSSLIWGRVFTAMRKNCAGFVKL